MELAELAVKKALKKGMTEAEAYASKSTTTRVEFDDKIRSFATTESTGIGLRVALGKRLGAYSTSILEEKEIDSAVETAVKIAKVAAEDPSWQHLNKIFGKAPAEGYYDKAVEALGHDEIVDTIRTAVARVRDFDKRITPSLGSLTIDVVQTTVANSHGLNGEMKETGVSVSLRAKSEEAGQQSSGRDLQQARAWKAIDFEGSATRTAEQAIRFLKAKQIESSKGPVIIRNQVFADMLQIMLSDPTNANCVQMGRSPLAGKLKTKIASDNFTLVDDGLLRGGLQTKPFDDEGHPTQTTAVIDKGVLQNFLYDNYTGLKAGAQSTGNAQRGNYWTEPTPAPSNFILKPGTAKPEDIVRNTKRGIYVENTIGEWLSDRVSGSLNATVTHGFIVRNGELTDTIKGGVISGSFYDILKNGVEMIGNDVRNSGQYYSPTIKLSGLTIAGKE
jgi:PmbA protein